MIGTLQLLAACERTETLRTRGRPRLGRDLRLRGRGAVRSTPRTLPGEQPLRTRFQRDISELEEYFDNFARRHPELTLLHAALPARGRPGPRQPAGPLPEPAGGPGAARLRPAAAAPARRGRDRGDRRRGRATRSAAPVNVAPVGLDLAQPRAAAAAAARRPGAAPAVRAADGAARRPARRRRRCSATGSGCCASGAGSTTAGCSRRSASSRATTPPARSATWRRDGDGRRVGARPAPRRARRPARAARGPGPMSAARDEALAPEARRRLPARACAAGSRTASTRWPPPSGAPARCRGGCASAIELIVAPARRATTTRTSGASTRSFAEAVFPLFEFLYDVLVAGARPTGVRNVPAHGRALIVSNHAGSLFPFDATMLTMAIMKEHPLPRWPRFMVLDWAFVLPVPLGLHAPGRRGPGEPPQRRPGCSARTSS